MMYAAVRREDSRTWKFAVEVAVRLTESDYREFVRMPVTWILNGTSHSDMSFQVYLLNFLKIRMNIKEQ